MKKKIRNRVVSILLTVVILVVSCVTPFFTSSAIAVTTGLAIAGLSALIGSLAAGIANGSAQELTGQLITDITNAAELVSDNWGTGVNSIATDFNNFVSDFFDGYTIDGVSVNGSDVARYVDYDSGTATINFDEYENLRKQFAGSLYKPESDLVDDYLSLGGLPVIYRGTSGTITFSDILNLRNKYISHINGGNLSFVFLANVSGEWCHISTNRFTSSNSSVLLSSIHNNDSILSVLQYSFNSSVFLSINYTISNEFSFVGNKITGGTFEPVIGSCTFYRVGDLSVVTGVPSDLVLVVTDYNKTSSSLSTVNDYVCKYISADTAIAGTVEIPDTDFKKNDIENTVINGQGVGVVSENPTLTFVPTDTATGATDVAIDGKPISEVDAAIEDVTANGDFDVETPSFIIDKFPFCIPFDIYKLFNILSAEPQAPQFQIPITIVDGEPVNIDIDLSEWDWIAECVRWFMWLIFVVGLLALTNKLIGRG